MVATTDRYTFARFSHDGNPVHSSRRKGSWTIVCPLFRTIFARKKEQGGFSTVVTPLISPHLVVTAYHSQLWPPAALR